MGIQCRIIRNNKGKVSYVEAPNGNRSKLYDDAVTRVGEDSALDVVLTAYTPSFIEEVKNPKIIDFRRQLIDRINSLPSTVGNVSLKLNGIDQVLNTNTLEMTTEDLGNGETLISFQAELETRYSMEGYVPVAPNGELSNLSVAQWQQVRTPEFMEWSNNWNDVLKDENGEPQVHYHGTSSGARTTENPDERTELTEDNKFYIFDSGTGVEFFSPRREIALTYAGFGGELGIYDVFIKSPKTLDVAKEIPNEVNDFINKNWSKIADWAAIKKVGKEATLLEIHRTLQTSYNWEVLEYPPFVDFLKEQGYTAMRTLEQGGNIGIFDKTSIKSATENTGAFDNTNPDIRFQQNENEAAPRELLEGLVERLQKTGLAKDAKIVNSAEIKEILTQKGQASRYKDNINGFVLDDIVYINVDNAGLDTPMHEFGHLWNSWAQQNAEDVYNRGIELIKESGQEYIDFVREQQPDLEGDEVFEEALAQAIGDSGAKMLEKKAKQGFIDWLKALWKAVALKTGILSYDVADSLGDLSLRDFTDAVAIDLFKGNKTYSRPTPVVPVTDISKAPVMKVNKEGHSLSFVSQEDLIDIDAFLKKASEEGSRVSFWMGDQLGRGTYTDSVTGQEHYLDAGLSYALDPENRSRNVIWASGAAKKTLQRLVDESDYVIIMSGSAQAAKLFNKAVFDVFSARVGDFKAFKEATLPVATKPFRAAIEKHDSWESLRDSTDRKKLLIEVNAAEQTKSSGLKEALTQFNAFIDYNTMRDGFLVDNNVDINDMMLVLKPTGVGKKSTHSTYGWEVEGEVIGVPDRKVNAFDVIERKRRAYAGELAPAAQQQVIAPFGIGTGRKIQFSITKKEAEAKTDLYLERINKVREDNLDQYWSVDMPTREQVLDAAMNDRLVDVNGGMGIVTEDGNMIGLFKYDTSAKGTAASVQQARIEKGGIKLDNFDGYLTKLYKKNGFKVVSRLPFNEEFAPEGWNKEKHGTPDVVFMIYDPKGELGIEERTFDASDYDGALAYRDQFVEEVKDIHPFYREGLTINKTGETQNFFSDVVTGKSDKFKAKKEWTSILPFTTKEMDFKATFDKFKGNFDNHIATSIPTFRETQIKVGNAITEMFKGTDALVYDIGGSEGGFVKAITEESNGKIKSINLDLNSDMRDAHNKVPVEGSKFVLEAFYEGYTDEDTGVTYKRHKPKQKADVVHESMVFQFIAPERDGFIKEVKRNYLKEDGIALFEEKLSTYQEDVWLENERKKNEYKSIYYSQEAITQKSDEVLVGMKKNQTYREEFLEILNREFDFVEEYWDAGNFKGYLATNSESRKNEFLEKLGGRIQSQYSENKTKPKFSVGFMQTKTTPQGEQVMLSNVDDQVQGQGLGTEMYKQVASKLASQGTSLVSDFNNKGAEGIWGKLDEAGATETIEIDGKRVTKIKMTPDSFDTNGEPNVSDVVQYIQTKNYEGVTLSEIESNEVSNVLLGTDMKDSEELYRALRRAFTPNGIYNPSEDSLMASGLYSRVEARRLLDSEEAQLTAYEMMHKIKNSDNISNDTEVDNTYITITPNYNSLGTLIKANPFINQKTAREVLGGIKDETLFSNQAEANDLEFANKKFEELSKLTKVNKVKVEEGRTTPHTNIDDLRTRLEETLTLPTDTKLISNLNYILSVPNDVWNLEFSNVRTILEEIEGNAVDIGLDLSNLNEESYDKTPTEVKTLLSAVRNFAAIQNETTFEILLDEYVNFFDISESNNVATVEISEETANKTLVYSDTKSDAYTLFNNNGLLPLGNNLYQKVNTNKSIDEVYDIVYQTVKSGKKILPAQAFKNEYDVTDSKNEEFVRQDIVNYANEASKDIENNTNYDTDTLRKMVLFSAYFGTKLNNNRATPSIIGEMDLMVNFPKNAEYLKTEFISDFNKSMIKEKVKNSEKYNNFYKHFDISSEGIELVNTDPITMREIQPYLTDDLVNHFKIKKEGMNLKGITEGVPMNKSSMGVLLNYYINYPQTLPLYKGTYQMDNEILITNTNPSFLRVNEGTFVYIETVGNKSLFGRLEKNNSDFKDYSTALRAPQIGEISKFNIAQGVKADKKINNLYTKKQDTDLTNEIDNC